MCTLRFFLFSVRDEREGGIRSGRGGGGGVFIFTELSSIKWHSLGKQRNPPTFLTYFFPPEGGKEQTRALEIIKNKLPPFFFVVYQGIWYGDGEGSGK